MYVVSTFNPLSQTTGTFDMNVQPGGHIVVANESSANLILTFPNGTTTYVPANDKRLYCLSGQMAQPHTIVKWTQQSVLPNPNNINQTIVEAYQPGEKVPETYPSPLIRQTNIAGSITATQLILTTATPHSLVIIKATDTNTGLDFLDYINGTLNLGNPSGGTVPGNLVLYNSSGGPSTQTNKTTVTPGEISINVAVTDGIDPLFISDQVTGKTIMAMLHTGVLQIGDTGTGAVAGQTKWMGNTFGPTQIDGSGNFIQNTGAKMVFQLIDATAIPSGAADMAIKVANTNRVVDNVGGIDTFSVDSSGIRLLNGTQSFITGSLSRISKFTAAVTTTSTFFNHNLGVVPDFVLLTIDGAASPTGRAVEAEFATMTSTQVKLTATASFNVDGLALKF